MKDLVKKVVMAVWAKAQTIGTSWLRTAVPIAWGWFITWVFKTVPDVGNWVQNTFGLNLADPYTSASVTSAITALWYTLWRFVEDNLPNWLTRLAMGSAKMPAYAAPVVPDTPVDTATN